MWHVGSAASLPPIPSNRTFFGVVGVVGVSGVVGATGYIGLTGVIGIGCSVWVGYLAPCFTL
ncbi:hypothetical protein PgNI_10288 [Pyricularia grisea]|uniref:Uncharacterized protein n=1 Tax=Pyricularia grisea TaxID=148305 RepID=A0A6P8AY12_PYRGI|nr:hypothetical protein PgNI_10288 [Pyricularia grisea]TLD07179.1 hypothetical protein PgNI_10288 [Pyricularia grisea]